MRWHCRLKRGGTDGALRDDAQFKCGGLRSGGPDLTPARNGIHPLCEIVIETAPLQEGVAEEVGHCAMMDISYVPDCTAAALRRCASDPTPMRMWDRDNASGPPTLTDVQRGVHERMSEQLSMAGQVIAAGGLVSGDSHAEDIIGHAEPPLRDSVSPPPDADAGAEQQDALPAGRARWWTWTAALLGANATQGAFETFVGRLGEALVHVLSGRPQNPQEVSDTSMAAHAAINMVMGLIAGARVGVHTWRARGNPEAYCGGLHGERPAQSAAFAMAGTPNVPVSQLMRLVPSLLTAIATFGVAAHTGMRALSHLRSSSNAKVNAYEAVVRSNGNMAYCYTRELANLAAHGFQLVSHDALLTPLGALASSVEYGLNLLAQAMIDIDPVGGFDLRRPAISAPAEAIDVAFTSGAARFAGPDRPVAIWRGRLAEGTSAETDPPSGLTIIGAIDRVTQRAAARQLIGEISNTISYESGRRPIQWLAVGTHLRELMWQAENVSRSSGARRALGDIEAPPPVWVSPHAGSSEVTITPRQEGQEVIELPSRADLNAPPPDVSASPSSAEEGDTRFVDRSVRSLDITPA